MRLVLAEKPSVARELARALGCTKKERTHFTGPNDLVTWAIGHLVKFAEPDQMNPAWGKPWRRDPLPMIPREWVYLAEPNTEDQFKAITRLMNDKRITSIVNATDAGREGEAIFRRIYRLAGCTKPVLRFWTSSLTDEAIAAAFRRLKPAEEYDNLGAAADARAQLDWLIGMNHTRASTLHNGTLCSIGRVQTPTLAMIVRRHHEIEGFIKTLFYEVHADMDGFLARALNPQQRYDFDQRVQAEAILAAIPEGTSAVVTAMERKPKRTPPPMLHNLGELQKEANRRFGLTSDRTLEAAQSLYEAKAITYPRSSSRHLPEDMAGELAGVLRALRMPGREPQLAAALARASKGPKLGKRFLDNAKLSDHHAIIPTAKGLAGSGGNDERRVYQIVTERFVTMFLPDRETEETRIDLSLSEAKHPFRARGTRIVAPGWTAFTGGHDFERKPDDEEEQQPLPEVKAGQILHVLDAELVTKERKPPARYTDATLLTAMETAGREIDDEALREAMRGRGLGTEATRASIIKQLIDREYVMRTGKVFDPTPKGISLIAQVLPHLASPELTGDMEARLSEIEQGKLSADVLLDDVAQSLRRDIPQVFRAAILQAPSAPPITAGKDELVCPRCKAGLLTLRPGQSFYGCARFKEGCTFTVQTVVAKKTLTPAQIKELVQRGRTKTIKGFRSKAGKPFDAMLVLREGRTEFEFER